MWRDCQHPCSLRKGARLLVWGRGVSTASVALVGEAPGEEEDREGQPFVGRAGKLLDAALGEVGVNRNTLWITNAVKCRPVKDGKNMPPTEESIIRCAGHLEDELRALPNLRIIVALGAYAAKALGVKLDGRILRSVGKTFDTRFGPVVINMHPAYVLRNPGAKPQFVNVFRALFGGIDSRQRATSFTKIIEDFEAAKVLFDQLRKYPEWAFDTEGRLDGLVCGVSFCWRPGIGVYLPLTRIGHFGDVVMEWPEEENEYIVRNLRQVMEGPAGKVGHNISHDMWSLWKSFGIVVQNVVGDTMLQQLVVDHRVPANLEYLSSRYVDMAGYYNPLREYVAANKIDVRKHGYTTIPVDILGPYAARDADATMRLHVDAKTSAEWDERERRLYTEILLPATEMFCDMTRTGIGVDIEYARKARDTIQQEIWEMQRWFSRSFPRPVNPASNQDVAWLLFEHCRLEPLKRSETTGDPSVDNDVLKKLKDVATDAPTEPAIRVGIQEIVQAILDFRWKLKVAQTYLSMPEEFAVDGRFHPRYQVARAPSMDDGAAMSGAISGRVTCRDPALQTLPRESWVRKMLVSKPGHVFLVADYSNMELRFLAHLAQDKAMLDAFERGDDLHRVTAAAVMGLEPEEITKDQRQIGKAINFLTVYGGTQYALRKQIPDLSEEKAAEYIQAWFGLYKGVDAWRKRQIEYARKHGYVNSPFGRKRFVEVNDRKGLWERIAVNHPIQSGASDFCLHAMVDAWRYLRQMKLETKIVLQVYDSVEFEVPREELTPDLINDLRNIMVSPVPGTFNGELRVDFEIGTNMGELTAGAKAAHVWGREIADAMVGSMGDGVWQRAG